LIELGRALGRAGYAFVAVTPETHQRVLDREPRLARSLRDVFGWSRPFAEDLLEPPFAELARAAGVITTDGTHLRSTVRFSSLGDKLWVHSAFPTVEKDSVFFGPDTYRFCAWALRCLPSTARLVDVGCGSGVGGLLAAPRAAEVVLADVNPLALRFARVNAALCGAEAEIVLSDVLSAVTGKLTAVIGNPPYLVEDGGRVYRNGGGTLGEELALRIVEQSLSRLEPRGMLVLYTGAPIVEGQDTLRRALEPLCRSAGATFRYEELDPDIFGSELERPAYAEVERIAAIGLLALMP